MTNTVQLEVNANDTQFVETMPLRTSWQVIQTGGNILNHVVTSIVAIYMTWLTYNAGNSAISWHAFLCTAGVISVADGTSNFSTLFAKYLDKTYTRQIQRRLHWSMQLIGSSAAIIGMVIEYIGRSQKGKLHFKSIHSLIGLSAGILALISMLGGLSALWSIELKKYARPITFKLVHSSIGVTTFVLGMISLYLGYDKNFMIKNSQKDIRMGLQILAITTIILTLMGASRAILNHIRVACTKY